MGHKIYSRRKSSSKSSDSFGCLIGGIILCIIIYLIAFAVGIIGLLFPLLLILMWSICKKWSKSTKIIISIVVISIWIILLPFIFQYFGWLTSDTSSDNQASQFSTFAPVTQQTSIPNQNNILVSKPTPSTSPTIAPTALPTNTPSPTPTNEPTATPLLILKNGLKGEAVMQMQTRLEHLGYLQSEPDGVFGSQTENAVKAFQKKNGLQADGVAGEKTLTLLYSNNAKKQIWVWIPTNGGKKYHANQYCSDMIDPQLVTLEEAVSLGFEACGKNSCY